MDLVALKAYLDSLGSHPTLAASDAHLPAPLQAVLASMPAHQIALGVGPDGVSVVGTTLTVTGTTTDAWPVSGMSGGTVTLATATFLVRDVAPPPKVDAHLAGTLPIGAAVAYVTLAPVARPVVGSAAVAGG